MASTCSELWGTSVLVDPNAPWVGGSDGRGRYSGDGADGGRPSAGVQAGGEGPMALFSALPAEARMLPLPAQLRRVPQTPPSSPPLQKLGMEPPGSEQIHPAAGVVEKSAGRGRVMELTAAFECRRVTTCTSGLAGDNEVGVGGSDLSLQASPPEAEACIPHHILPASARALGDAADSQHRLVLVPSIKDLDDDACVELCAPSMSIPLLASHPHASATSRDQVETAGQLVVGTETPAAASTSSSPNRMLRLASPSATTANGAFPASGILGRPLDEDVDVEICSRAGDDDNGGHLAPDGHPQLSPLPEPDEKDHQRTSGGPSSISVNTPLLSAGGPLGALGSLGRIPDLPASLLGSTPYHHRAIPTTDVHQSESQPYDGGCVASSKPTSPVMRWLGRLMDKLDSRMHHKPPNGQ